MMVYFSIPRVMIPLGRGSSFTIFSPSILHLAHATFAKDLNVLGSQIAKSTSALRLSRISFLDNPSSKILDDIPC